MANKSGKSGKLVVGASKILGVRNIQTTQTSNNPQFATSETNGHKITVGGVKNATMSADIVLDTDERLEDRMEVGDAVTLLVYEDASVSETYPMRLESISKAIDINDGGEVTQAVTFSPNGRWTFSGGGASLGSVSS